MNYNPYYFNPYMNIAPAGRSLLGGLFRGSGLNFASILGGTQKVLNIASQAIPVIKQVGPVMKNAKTMFRVFNEFKKMDIPISKNTETTNNTSATNKTTNSSNNTNTNTNSSNNTNTTSTNDDSNTTDIKVEKTSNDSQGPTFFQ